MTRLTPNAAAARCGKSRATIIRAIAAKALPAEKQGSQWSIEGKDLDRWAAQKPLRARRRLERELPAGGIPENVEAASSTPLSASESDSQQRVGANEHVEALKAVCEALQEVCNGLRADVEALRRQVAHLSASPSPEASESAAAPKRRLWPF
jgi:excisionase family DNA binding protein